MHSWDIHCGVGVVAGKGAIAKGGIALLVLKVYAQGKKSDIPGRLYGVAFAEIHTRLLMREVNNLRERGQIPIDTLDPFLDVAYFYIG